MDSDSTQLFDPESNTLNPRAQEDHRDVDGIGNSGGDPAPHDWLGSRASYDAAQNSPPTDADQREHARTTDPSTSKRAAQGHGRNASVRRDTQKHTLLAAYDTRGPMTADEACETTRMIRAWRRVSDLLAGGFLEDTGNERLSRQGRPQRVLRITNLGEAALKFFADTDRKVYRA